MVISKSKFEKLILPLFLFDLKYSNFRVWETIEEIAKFIKKVDPNHPTMTVIAGLDPAKVFMIKNPLNS